MSSRPLHPSEQTYGALDPSEEEDGSFSISLLDRSFHRPDLRASLRDVRSSVRSSVRLLMQSSFVLDGSQCSVRDLGGEATVVAEIFNMAKNLIGGGVLSLSGGMAIFSNEPRGASLTAAFWMVVLGTIFGYFCLLIAIVCAITKSATYRECWQETMGEAGSLAVSLTTAIKPALGNLAYSTILSQTVSSLSLTIGWPIGRLEALLLITVVALLPLCLLKNLSVLAPFSILGTAGILLTAAAMLVRYLDGSYQIGGRFYSNIDEDRQPDFGQINQPWSPAVLPFLCMIFEAYVMHYNSPRFYIELRRTSIPRFALVVQGSFGFSAVVYTMIAVTGFLTFGGHSDGYILNNYSPHDPLATVCRLCIALSTLMTFPLVFIGFRDGVLDCLEVPAERQTSANLNVLTVVLLTIITATASVVTDLGMINAVGGGSLGTLIVFVYPALMYQKAVAMLGDQASARQQHEVKAVMSLMVLGLVLGITGVVVSIQTGG